MSFTFEEVGSEGADPAGRVFGDGERRDAERDLGAGAFDTRPSISMAGSLVSTTNVAGA